MWSISISLLLLPFVAIFAQLPASSTYKLNSYGVGSGGVGTASSSTYSIEGISGEQSSGQLVGTTYSASPGFIYTQQANIPAPPTFTNPSNYYNKLHFVINTSGNPTDAKYAVAISSDNFVTTYYVQSDNTISTVLGLEDYQTYVAWGSGTGVDILGLQPGTTYKIKAKATQGKFTESGYSATASVATVNPSLSFSITTDSQPIPPFSISFGSLVAGSVNTSSDKVNVSLSTNAQNGGQVYIYDAYSGIRSTQKSYTISSATADLASAQEGYGAVSVSAGQSSGGPFTASSPYNGTADNVGILDTSIRQAYGSTTPVTSATGSFRLKVRSRTLTPSATDYSDMITLIATAQF